MEWHLHVRVHHLGVARPFRCLFCREGFTTDAELASHVGTHNKPFSCPVCAESFLVEFLLDRHLETHHRCLDVDADVPPASTLPPVLTCLALDAAAAASVLYSQVPLAESVTYTVHRPPPHRRRPSGSGVPQNFGCGVFHG